MESLVKCNYCDIQGSTDDFKLDMHDNLVCAMCQSDIILQTATIKIYDTIGISVYKWNSLFGFTNTDDDSIELNIDITGYTITPNAMIAQTTDNISPVIRGWMTGKFPKVSHKHLTNTFYDSLNSRKFIPDIPLIISLSQNGPVTMAVEIFTSNSDHFVNWLETNCGIMYEQLKTAFK